MGQAYDRKDRDGESGEGDGDGGDGCAGGVTIAASGGEQRRDGGSLGMDGVHDQQSICSWKDREKV